MSEESKKPAAAGDGRAPDHLAAAVRAAVFEVAVAARRYVHSIRAPHDGPGYPVPSTAQLEHAVERFDETLVALGQAQLEYPRGLFAGVFHDLCGEPVGRGWRCGFARGHEGPHGGDVRG